MKKALGRGIDALFSDESLQEDSPLRQVPVRLIDRGAEQPRTDFDAESLQALADSISTVGVIQPLTVTQNGERYTLVAGERRWRAARLAGLNEVPCLVIEAAGQRRSEIALIENLQREDLNAVEKALALKTYIETHKLTQEETASRLGLSRPAIANLLRLLRLPEEIQKLLREGKLSEGHARALCAVEDRDAAIRLAQRIIDEDLSVRRVEELCKKLGEAPKMPKPKLPDPELEEVLQTFRQAFGTQVALQGTQKKGKLVISYSSMEELERIYELIRDTQK